MEYRGTEILTFDLKGEAPYLFTSPDCHDVCVPRMHEMTKQKISLTRQLEVLETKTFIDKGQEFNSQGSCNVLSSAKSKDSLMLPEAHINTTYLVVHMYVH